MQNQLCETLRRSRNEVTGKVRQGAVAGADENTT